MDCEFSKPVWDNTILPLHILEASFESWLSQVVDLDDENKSRSIIAILWTVWKNRNEYVWNNKQWNVNAIRISVTNCIKDWQCWCDLQKANTSSIPLQTVQRTQGIDASWVYCEVDASVIENSASFGAVIRTHSGLFLAAISGPLRPITEQESSSKSKDSCHGCCEREGYQVRTVSIWISSGNGVLLPLEESEVIGRATSMRFSSNSMGDIVILIRSKTIMSPLILIYSFRRDVWRMIEICVGDSEYSSHLSDMEGVVQVDDEIAASFLE
nr:F-box protein At5g62510-like [Ipomoea batatas]